MDGVSVTHLFVCRVLLIFVLTIRFGLEGTAAAIVLETLFEMATVFFLLRGRR